MSAAFADAGVHSPYKAMLQTATTKHSVRRSLFFSGYSTSRIPEVSRSTQNLGQSRAPKTVPVSAMLYIHGIVVYVKSCLGAGTC